MSHLFWDPRHSRGRGLPLPMRIVATAIGGLACMIAGTVYALEVPEVPAQPRIMVIEEQERMVIQNGVNERRIVRVAIEFQGIDERTLATWIFRTQDLQLARSQAEAVLDKLLDQVADCCSLTDGQRDKLRLAGEGDISRFLSECELSLRELAKEKPTADHIRAVQLTCQKLRTQYRAGLHGEESLFQKMLDATVSDDQRKLLQAVLQVPDQIPGKAAPHILIFNNGRITIPN